MADTKEDRTVPVEAERLPDGTLVEAFDYPADVPISGSVQGCITTGGPEALVSKYGEPVDAATAAQLCPAGEGGLIWHAQIVTDDWKNKADCNDEGEIKPRRAILPVRQKDFFSSLVKTDDGRWIFSGVLNGWPGFTTMEVLSITYKKDKTFLKNYPVQRCWTKQDGADGKPPAWPEKVAASKDKKKFSVRVTLRSPPSSAKGWNKESPGYVWWFAAQRKKGTH